MSDALENRAGLVQIPSIHPAVATADRLEALLKDAGITVFARIDCSADAARAGVAMPAELLPIFGNPKAGTPLMVAKPSVGLDLPLRRCFGRTPTVLVGRLTMIRSTSCVGMACRPRWRAIL